MNVINNSINFFSNNYLYKKLLTLPASYRRLILVFIDFILLIFSSMLFLSYNLLELENKYSFFYSFFISIFGIAVYIFSGQYKSLTRYFGSGEIYKLFLRNLFIVLFIYFCNSQFQIVSFNSKTLILFWFIINGSIGLFKLISRDVIISIANSNDLQKKKSIIYGAGKAGIQLWGLLKLTDKFKIKYFLDDKPELWNREINGKKILSRGDFEKVIQRENIDVILLSIPSLKPTQKIRILNYLRKFNIPILQIPPLDEINSGMEKISSLKSLRIEDFLGRDEVLTDWSLLEKDFKNKNIIIFGAAGSIGFEIGKQLFKYNPKNLIFFDHSEIGMYELTQYFESINIDKKVQIVPILGSCLDIFLVDRILKKYKVDIIFHAAAYKHVPLVQLNPIQGIKNNILSTLIICKSAIKNSVEKVLLISSDKAVRPTNIMGASKRVSEMILQAFYDKSSKDNKSIIFSMVRFGNVLNSSGSVIPLFEKQIEQGGPVTVTHPEITRYFMTIKEASQLVLQASTLAEGGEVFLLDMGSPVLIYNLAKKIINLKGHVVKDKDNPKGDIEIIFSGLRPGEKLYEELLVDANAESTKHPLIYKANEKFVDFSELLSKLDELKLAIKNQDLKKVNGIIFFLVPEMKISNSDINY